MRSGVQSRRGVVAIKRISVQAGSSDHRENDDSDHDKFRDLDFVTERIESDLASIKDAQESMAEGIETIRKGLFLFVAAVVAKYGDILWDSRSYVSGLVAFAFAIFMLSKAEAMDLSKLKRIFKRSKK